MCCHLTVQLTYKKNTKFPICYEIGSMWQIMHAYAIITHYGIDLAEEFMK